MEYSPFLFNFTFMWKITVKGEAKTDYIRPEEIDGVECQDEFSEYFDDTSYSDEVSGGYMDFRFEDGKLWTYTEYSSERELTSEELSDLEDYTTGQWSDGIGEGFEQEPCMYSSKTDEEVYVSPCFFGQETSIFQEQVN